MMKRKITFRKIIFIPSDNILDYYQICFFYNFFFPKDIVGRGPVGRAPRARFWVGVGVGLTIIYIMYYGLISRGRVRHYPCAGWKGLFAVVE